MYTTHIYICTQPAIQTAAPSMHTNTNSTGDCILSPSLADKDEDPLVGDIHICTTQVAPVAGLIHLIYSVAGSGCPVCPAAGTWTCQTPKGHGPTTVAGTDPLAHTKADTDMYTVGPFSNCDEALRILALSYSVSCTEKHTQTSGSPSTPQLTVSPAVGLDPWSFR